MTEEERVAGALLRAVERMEKHEFAEASSELDVVTTALAHTPDLEDVLARAWSLHAQCHLELGNLGVAASSLDRAQRIARKLGDRDGLVVLNELRNKLADSQETASATALGQERAKRLLQASLEDLRASATPPSLPSLLVERATAHLDLGEPEHARELAAEALALLEGPPSLGGPRDRVLALLTLARADAPNAKNHMLEALVVAQNASDFNLVTAVAKAAAASDIPLPKQYGPATGESS